MPDPIIPSQTQDSTPPTFPEMTDIPTVLAVPQDTGTTAQVSEPMDIPPIIAGSSPPKRKRGKIIATILGILLLVGAVGAGVILVSQKQLFQQKAAGGPYCDGICVFNQSCRINGCETSNSVVVEMVRYHCDTISPNGCAGPEVERQYTYSMEFQENCGSEQIDAFGTVGMIQNGWAHIDYSQDCTSPTPTTPPGATPTPTPTRTPTPTPTRTPTPPPPLPPPSSTPSTPGPTGPPTPTPTLPPPAGFTPTPTPAVPSPTPPPNAVCSAVKAYDTSWNPLTGVQLSALSAGDIVRFTISGTPADKIKKARFTIQAGTQSVVTDEITQKKPLSDEYFYEYTIPSSQTSFKVSAQIYHEPLGWF